MRTGRTLFGFGFGLIMVRGLVTGILGYRVVWLAWFGVANRVVYEVRSGWGIAGRCGWLWITEFV